nr:hypothetical protein Iba_chr14eCG5350 [Ipomoea batatas]
MVAMAEAMPQPLAENRPRPRLGVWSMIGPGHAAEDIPRCLANDRLHPWWLRPCLGAWPMSEDTPRPWWPRIVIWLRIVIQPIYPEHLNLLLPYAGHGHQPFFHGSEAGRRLHAFFLAVGFSLTTLTSPQPRHRVVAREPDFALLPPSCQEGRLETEDSVLEIVFCMLRASASNMAEHSAQQLSFISPFSIILRDDPSSNFLLWAWARLKAAKSALERERCWAGEAGRRLSATLKQSSKALQWRGWEWERRQAARRRPFEEEAARRVLATWRANGAIAITTPFLEYKGCGSKRINFPDFPVAKGIMYTSLVPVLEKAILQGIAEPEGIAVIAASSGSISESKQTNILYCTGKLSCKREGGNGETELPLLSSNPTSNMRDASIRQWLLEQTLWIISSLKKNVVTVASRF